MTIEEVAKRAGVSRMTVSRVLSGSDGVKEQTRRRVQKAMQQLKYIPSAAARALRSKDNLRATGALCFVIVFGADTQLSDGFFCNVARGAEEAASEHSLCPLHVHSQKSFVDAWPRMQVALSVPGLCGALLCGHFEKNEVESIHEHLNNIVIVDGLAPSNISVGSVEPDYLDGCIIAFEHMAEQKIQKLLVLGGGGEHYFSRFVRMSAQLRKDRFQQVHIAGCEYTNESAYKTIKELFSEKIAFDGVFGNDEQCIGALRAFIDLGIKVPQQVKVIGFDDIPHAQYTHPRLTTVSIDKMQLGRQAVQMLVNMIRNLDGLEQVKRTIKAKLVIRDSA